VWVNGTAVSYGWTEGIFTGKNKTVWLSNVVGCCFVWVNGRAVSYGWTEGIFTGKNKTVWLSGGAGAVLCR
jgi:hypothetical protein